METAKLLATEIDDLLIQLVDFKIFGSDDVELLTVRVQDVQVDLIMFEEEDENSVFFINLIFITFKLER